MELQPTHNQKPTSCPLTTEYLVKSLLGHRLRVVRAMAPLNALMDRRVVGQARTSARRTRNARQVL